MTQENRNQALFGLGCFWGVERRFWETQGVLNTAVGYTGGKTENPTYDEVCTGTTDHNEVVLMEFDPAIISYNELLSIFWNSHNPTQGMRQGNDCGSQYRSSIFTFNDEQAALANASMLEYQTALDKAGHGTITTEILPAPVFYYAEDYHQQYLLKNPDGYCSLAGLETNQE